MITHDDYQKVDIRIGQIISAEKVENADKLLKLVVNFGETKTDEMGASVNAPRQIISGIALYYPEPSALIGKKCAFVVNLEPRIIRNLESQGMILAASDKTASDPVFSLLEVSAYIPVGTKVA